MENQENCNKQRRWQRFFRSNCTAAAIAAVLGTCGVAGAFEIETGNEDLAIHWDNTFRYTLAQRVKGQSKDLIGSINQDDGDRNFNVGIVSSRLDLLSEADVVYKKNFGVRVSGAGWYDPIYRMSLDNNSPQTSNHLGANGQPALGQPDSVKRRYGGPSGELLDAFVFGKLDMGEVPLSVRVGRHTIYWGEAFFPAAGSNSISYGQSPLDLAKALAMPGVELKEIFRPLNQVSFTVQPTQDLTFAGQYYLQWEANTFPEGGTYLGMLDGMMNDGESFFLPVGPGGAPVPVRNGGDHTPREARDWGLKASYSPEAINATIGFYYRNFSDKMPQVLLDATGYHFDYKSNIDLYGISFAKNILGISVGSEVSYRRNMPLTSQWFAPAGARGDTMHAVVNFLSLLPKTPVFDSGSAILEFAYGRWNRVTSNSNFFTGTPGTNILGGPTNVGVDHATRDNSTMTVNVVPEWKQVMPGIDLSMPLNFSVGLHGNAATLTGGAKDSGNYSAGLSLDLYNKYKIDLTYAAFFGIVHPDGNGQIFPPGLAAPGQGAGDAIAMLRDRDLLSLTLKTSF